MYIKLVQPRMIKRPMDTDLKLHMAPPLGLLTVAALLRDQHRIVLENENIEPVNYDDHPDIVGISVTVDTLPHAMQIAKRFRKRGAIVVAGGIHITTAYETIPENAFDVLCIGAAEGTWRDIVRDAQNGCLKKRYQCSGKLRGEDIVSPAYDLIDRGKYLYTSVIHTSRGCPFRCDFCYNSAKSHHFVNRPIPDVLREIRQAGTRHIMFIDDNFAGNPKWTKALLKELMPMKLKWQAAVSINAAKDPRLLDMMRKSGCQSLFIGFESINPESVQNVHKVQNSTKEYEQAIREIHKRGIMINGSFVFGLDGDTPETFDATVDWIVKNRIETVTSHILTPYPGTALYDRMQRAGRITSHDLSLYNTAHVVFQPQGMTAEELYKGYLHVYDSVYSLKNIRKRLPQTKSQRMPYLIFNLLYRRYGKFTDMICKFITYQRMGKIGEQLAKYM